ncbi:hypothetical protein TWF281_007839 [Arthrobotrys megalospora]
MRSLQTRSPATNIQGQGNWAHNPNHHYTNALPPQFPPNNGISTLFVHGRIPTFHRDDMEYEVTTTVSGQTPAPRNFLATMIQEAESDLSIFSEWSFAQARVNGYVFQLNRAKNEHTWGWVVNPFFFGTTIWVTTKICMIPRTRPNFPVGSGSPRPRQSAPSPGYATYPRAQNLHQQPPLWTRRSFPPHCVTCCCSQ